MTGCLIDSSLRKLAALTSSPSSKIIEKSRFCSPSNPLFLREFLSSIEVIPGNCFLLFSSSSALCVTKTQENTRNTRIFHQIVSCVFACNSLWGVILPKKSLSVRTLEAESEQCFPLFVEQEDLEKFSLYHTHNHVEKSFPPLCVAHDNVGKSLPPLSGTHNHVVKSPPPLKHTKTHLKQGGATDFSPLLTLLLLLLHTAYGVIGLNRCCSLSTHSVYAAGASNYASYLRYTVAYHTQHTGGDLFEFFMKPPLSPARFGLQVEGWRGLPLATAASTHTGIGLASLCENSPTSTGRYSSFLRRESFTRVSASICLCANLNTESGVFTCVWPSSRLHFPRHSCDKLLSHTQTSRHSSKASAKDGVDCLESGLCLRSKRGFGLLGFLCAAVGRNSDSQGGLSRRRGDIRLLHTMKRSFTSGGMPRTIHEEAETQEKPTKIQETSPSSSHLFHNESLILTDFAKRKKGIPFKEFASKALEERGGNEQESAAVSEVGEGGVVEEEAAAKVLVIEEAEKTTQKTEKTTKKAKKTTENKKQEKLQEAKVSEGGCEEASKSSSFTSFAYSADSSSVSAGDSLSSAIAEIKERSSESRGSSGLMQMLDTHTVLPKKPLVYPAKIITWNANSILQRMNEGSSDWTRFVSLVKRLDADVVCIQEVRIPAHAPPGAKRGDGQMRDHGKLKTSDKASQKEASLVLSSLKRDFPAYQQYWSLAEWKYAGQLVLAKQNLKVEKICFNLEDTIINAEASGAASSASPHSKDGRVILMFFKDFCLLSTYSPNHGATLESFDRRRKWDVDVLNFVNRLKTSNIPLIWTGDLNCAPEDIDLSDSEWFRMIKNLQVPEGYLRAMRKESSAKAHTHTSLEEGRSSCYHLFDSVDLSSNLEDYLGQPGCSNAERKRFFHILEEGRLIDVFRHLNPTSVSPPIDSPNYTWRGHPGRDAAEFGRYYGKAMRLDHMVMSESISTLVEEVKILGSGSDRVRFFGSDHCPVYLKLKPPTPSD